MTRQTTIREVARHAGVALATASRALSATGSVAPATRQRVLDSAAELDFHPNSHARSLRSDRSGSIGLLIPDVRNPYFAELAHQLEQTALADGMTILLCNGDENPHQLAMYVDVLRERRVDGVIAAPFADAADALSRLEGADIPTVFIDRMIPGSPTPSVTSDTAAAIDEAVELLGRIGHRRIGCITGPDRTSTGAERRVQVTDSARRHGLEVVIAPGDFQEDSGREGAAGLLDQGLEAIIAADSLMALGALRTCLDREVVIGEDIDLIGFDDIPAFTLTRPAMTVIDQDLQAMASTAYSMLSRLRDGQHVEPVRLDTTLIVRDSTRPPMAGRIPS